MSSVKERFLVDEVGNRMAVVVSLEDYWQLLADAEELDAIRAYDAAKASGKLRYRLFMPWLSLTAPHDELCLGHPPSRQAGTGRPSE
jgi:hypothetical protein